MASGREFTTFLFNKEDFIGEVRVRTRTTDDHYLAYMFSGKAMRVSDFSPPSERCQPLLVMHSISSAGVCFAMDTLDQQQQQPSAVSSLNFLYSSCLDEAKTAVVQMEDGRELHLVAMSRKNGDDSLQLQQQPCFWGFIAEGGAYNSCLNMLNLRCLALVFDLDETLLVANTMSSFDYRIEALSRQIRVEVDPERSAGLTAEMKRYQEDQSILTQYMETDRVFDNGKLVKVQTENVPSSADGIAPIDRPIIRLEDRNIILTRINPQARWTSVLVRLRPAWEDLRNYLIAKGRKRFEVFICTMSEKDYALEMWRLLDPDALLIPSIKLQERIVCVKAGGRKSLANVFRKGQSHPRLSMVIDDRLNVWEDADQPRVHVVPAFAPYYAPQAETSGTLPVLCIARNVASNVRGGFFKDFDDNLAQQMALVGFDKDISTLPKPLDVSSYLTPEKSAQDIVPTTEVEGVPKGLPDGMADSETENIWNPQARPRVEEVNARGPLAEVADNKEEPEPSGENWEEGEVPESEVDPDTRRRLLILQHGQDTEHNRVPGTSSEWDEEEMSPGRPGPPDVPVESESPSKRFDGMYSILGLMRGQRQERKLLDYSDADDRIYRINGMRENPVQPDPSSPIILLQGMAQKYKAQVEFRSSVCPTIELQFCVEVVFNGDKIARGFGRTSRDARTRASEDALRVLATELRDTTFVGFLPKQNIVSGQWNTRDTQTRNPDPPKLPTFNAVAALKDLCTVENLSVSFRDLELESDPSIYSCEVEISGQIMGRGRGLTCEAARQEASEEALRGMKSNNTGKRPRPRSPSVQNNKRMRLGGRGQGRGSRLSPRKPAQLAVRLK